MVQLQILNKVILEKSLHILNNNQLDDKYFPNYLDQYNFIVDHHRKYGNVPDDETILTKFPDFELLTVNESDKYLVESIQEEYLYSQVVPVLNHAAELLQSNSEDAVSYLLPRIKDLMVKHSYGAGTDIMQNTTIRYDKMLEKRDNGGMIGISSGMAELDAVLGGWMAGEELVTIVGRINQGKSWILLYFLAKAWEQKKRVLLYSGEMSSLYVGYRTDTLITHLSNRGMTRGTLDDNDTKVYESELKRMEEFDTPFIVVTPKDLGGKRLTVPMLESLIEKYKPDVVGIDQYSLMADVRSKGDPLRVQMAHVSEDLFKTSETYGIPIIADAQAKRKDDALETPELGDIAESDGIGQNSTRVISLAQQPTGVQLSIRKNRYGQNNVHLTYAWDIDKGEFNYLATPGETNAPEQLQVRNTRNAETQREQFKDGTEVF